jgi:hypothetical protein
MPNVREPLLNPVPITELRPTQITVGMREVKAKRKHWREQADAKGAEFLGKHMIPVILGPKQRHYVIDHHHLALALHEEGVKDILITVVANLSTACAKPTVALQFGAMPLPLSSLIALSFFGRCVNPIPRNTFGALVNWMLS